MTTGFALDDFDIDDPHLSKTIADGAMVSGNYPYKKKLGRQRYERQLLAMQVELVKLQSHLNKRGERIIIVFEGRDAAGKGGAIKRYSENINPRQARVVALSKPSDRERSQWYFQRYVSHLPIAGETVLFDRSWYNRGVVEPVLGFCTPEQTEAFLGEAPEFERMLTNDGIYLFKFWLNISRLMQIKRFHQRRHDPLKNWKLSPIDLLALGKWDDYTKARNEMLRRTHSEHAPWMVIRANDKRRARLAVISHVLSTLGYKGKDEDKISQTDRKIAMKAPDFLTGINVDE
ncbi:Polyphosphate kinase 2 [hydrothermal vent metagenome]|uniref:Polyphosphate kinase 2 n=1 Tax=hydrothermal vent metagenome TaxID=652676 RepID=A0A3B0TCE8_9ZZZZ